MHTETMAAARMTGVTKRYGAALALDNVSLDIERGKVTALLGPNGAGKTTTLALLLGLASPSAGRVEVLGGAAGSVSVRRRTGVMLQSAALPDTLRVGELLQLVSGYYPAPLALAEVARLAGIGELLATAYGRLSGGQQRRVQFALAVCGDPQLLFLDEPTTGLDIEARESLWAVVRELTARGRAILLTTHYLEEAEALAERVAVLVHGRIVSCGTTQEMRAQGVRCHVRCRSALSTAEVASWTGVNGARRITGVLEIETVHAEPLVRRLLSADPSLSELEVRRSGLAEAFVRITQEAA